MIELAYSICPARLFNDFKIRLLSTAISVSEISLTRHLCPAPSLDTTQPLNHSTAEMATRG